MFHQMIEIRAEILFVFEGLIETQYGSFDKILHLAGVEFLSFSNCQIVHTILQ